MTLRQRALPLDHPIDAHAPPHTFAWGPHPPPSLDRLPNLDLLVRIATDGNPCAGEDALTHLLPGWPPALLSPRTHAHAIATSALLPGPDGLVSPLRIWHDDDKRPPLDLRDRVRALARAPSLVYRVEDGACIDCFGLPDTLQPDLPVRTACCAAVLPEARVAWVCGRLVETPQGRVLALPFVFPDLPRVWVEAAIRHAWHSAQTALHVPLSTDQALSRAGHLLLRALHEAARIFSRDRERLSHYEPALEKQT